ncbi:hypothetical protein AHAS_Ahas18G0150200 [Arachis hypogaea]
MFHCTALEPLDYSVAPFECTTFDDPPKTEIGGGDGGNGVDSGGEARGNDGDKEFGALLNFEAIMKEAEGRGVKLPLDVLDAAKTKAFEKCPSNYAWIYR